MASPSVVGTPVESATTTATTTITCSFTQTTGDLVLILIGAADAASPTYSDGFTTVSGHLTDPQVTHWIYKILDGSEGGDVVVTWGLSTKGAAIAWNISGHSTSQAPEQGGSAATATSVSPNAGACTPTGGSKDYLFITGFRSAGEEADDDTWCTGTPTNYTGLRQKTTGTGGAASSNASIAGATRQLTAASDDAPAFTQAQSLLWQAFTMAVHPAVPTFAPVFLRRGSRALRGVADFDPWTVNQGWT